MSDQQDEGTRVGLWVVFGVVALVVIGVVGGVVTRHLTRDAGTAQAPAAVAAIAVETFVDGPLEGDLIGTVFFALGSSALPLEARGAIENAVAAAGAAPNRRLVLSGFHDASGSASANAEIAKARAIAVREALMADGVDGSRVVLRKPDVTLGDGAAPEARRVEIRLVD